MVRALGGEPEILILLPHAEQFAPERPGAIALHVRDVTRASRFKDRIRIFGPAVERPFAGFDFCPLQPAWHGLRGRNVGLAEALRRRLPDRQGVLVEVYNRPNMFAHLAARAPDLPLTLRLSNDPRTMRGARTAPERARLLARAQAIFCVSDFVRRRFLEGLEGHAAERDRQKLQVAFNGIPRTLAAPPEKEPLILFVGRIIAAKGVADLVAALERVLPRRPDWRAEIIGTSWTRRKGEPSAFEIALRERSSRLGSQALWPGYLPNDEVMARYRRAAIVVVPSLWDEPLARTAIEGLAAGCAVLAYAKGGLPEVMRGRGLLIEQPAPEALALALERVIADHALRARLQDQAWRDYPFGIEQLAERVDAVRERILAGLRKAA
ncbi:MAG TPA: glycosyltransferase family 4 protein [Geminicoccaceae bacterium]|nr:glycosyltransferase family 4 protein [Geminicoccaceae bacterium]